VSGSDKHAEATVRVRGAPFTKFSNGMLPPPYYPPPRTHEMTRCCVIGTGAITFSLGLSTVIADRGSTIRVKLAGQNLSHVTPIGIRVCLVQTVLEGGNRYGNAREVLCEAFFPSDCLASRRGEPAQSGAVSLSLSTLLDDLRLEGPNSQVVVLTVPTDCLPSSYEGGRSFVTHEVTCSIDMDAGARSNPTLSIPVRIIDHLMPPACDLGAPVSSNGVDQSRSAIHVLRLEPTIKFIHATVSTCHARSSEAFKMDNDNEEEPEIIVPQESPTKSYTERMHQLGTISPYRSVAIEIAYNSDADDFRQWIQSLSPRDFAFLAAKQSYQLTLWLAQRHSSLTCDHVVRLLRCDPGGCCSVVVELLLSYVCDLVTNHQRILEELCEWDRLVVQSAMDRAVDAAKT
jgi:hypothetical protein